MADLINIAIVVLLCGYLKWRFNVPLAWSWLAALAIPEVQAPLTTSLIDVPVNAAITIAVLAFLRMAIGPTEDHAVDGVIALAALGVAAWYGPRSSRIRCNSEIRSIPSRWRSGHSTSRGPSRWSRRTFSPMPGSTCRGRCGGSQRCSNSMRFGDAPRPWMPGQADVLQTGPSFRMGGYFVAYVLSAIAIVVWAARSSRNGRWPLALIAAFSLMCASFPYSSELRYYLFWMMSLVALMLALVYAPQFANPLQPIQRGVARGVVAVAFTSVVAMTGAYYFRSDGIMLRQLLQGTEAVVARVPEGGTLCIRNWDRRAILFAAPFHAPRNYHTRQLEFDEPADECTLRVTLND